MANLNISLIAAKAGVSKTSVSNYLNHKTEKLSKETAARIAEVIRECNYIPSFSARRMRNTAPSRTIGIIVTDLLVQSMFTVPLYGYMMRGIGKVLAKEGYMPLIIAGRTHGSQESVDYLKELSRGLVDGYILFNVAVDDEYARAFAEWKIPFIGMGCSKDFDNYVGTDYRSGAKDAAEYLIGRGCKRIGLSCGVDRSIVSRQLLEGFGETLRQNGINIEERFVFHSQSDVEESIFDELLALYQQGERPDGFILSEIHYSDLKRVADTLGFSLESEVKTVVYSGKSDSSGADAWLDIPFEAVGEAAAENVLRLIAGHEVGPKLFKPRLAVREGPF